MDLDSEEKAVTPASSTPLSPAVSVASTTTTPDVQKENDDFFTNFEKPKPASRTTSSRTTASIRSKSNLSSSASRARVGAKPLKLGAKKGAAAFNFEEAEARAKEESERAAKLGYDPAAEAAEEAAAAEESNSGSTYSSRLTYNDNSVSSSINQATEKQEDIDKLGFGMSRLGFGAVPQGASTQNKVNVSSRMTGFGSNPRSFDEDTTSESTSARDKFSNAKAISSDQFFGRGNYDESASAEARTRLAQFKGANSISSNQYFGRDEDENAPRGSTNPAGYEWDDLQEHATDLARKFVDQASADVGALKDIVEQGTSKVS